MCTLLYMLTQAVINRKHKKANAVFNFTFSTKAFISFGNRRKQGEIIPP